MRPGAKSLDAEGLAIARWRERHPDTPVGMLLRCPQCGGVEAVKVEGDQRWCTGYLSALHPLREMAPVAPSRSGRAEKVVLVEEVVPP